jgi:biotin carboxyl carrier protein
VDGPLAVALRERPWNYRVLYEELKLRAVEAHEESERRLRKAKDKYEDLLMNYYYRSDHVDVTWEEAQADMHARSAFKELPPELRKAWWEEYMERLRAKARARKARLAAEKERQAAEEAAAAAAAAAGGVGGAGKSTVASNGIGSVNRPLVEEGEAEAGELRDVATAEAGKKRTRPEDGMDPAGGSTLKSART